MALYDRPPTAVEQQWLDWLDEQGEAPEMDAALATCVKAWIRLGSCRPIGMAVGLIPFTAILAFAEFEEMDHEATELLVEAIVYADNERAKVEAEKRAEEARNRKA